MLSQPLTQNPNDFLFICLLFLQFIWLRIVYVALQKFYVYLMPFSCALIYFIRKLNWQFSDMEKPVLIVLAQSIVNNPKDDSTQFFNARKKTSLWKRRELVLNAISQGVNLINKFKHKSSQFSAAENWKKRSNQVRETDK